MPPTYPYAVLTVRLLLFAGGLLYVPPDFWSQVLILIEVPDPIKIAVAPLFGAICGTGVEYLNDMLEDRKRRSLNLPIMPPLPALFWPIKIVLSWIAGSFGGNMAEEIIKATPQNIAFWSGISSYGAIAFAIASQYKKVNDLKKSDDAE